MLALKSGEQELAKWSFAVTPDKAPVIRFTEEPSSAVNGTLELHYAIEDDYGAVSARLIFALDEEQTPGARPLYGAPEMPLTLPRRGHAGRSGQGVARPDRASLGRKQGAG